MRSMCIFAFRLDLAAEEMVNQFCMLLFSTTLEVVCKLSSGQICRCWDLVIPPIHPKAALQSSCRSTRQMAEFVCLAFDWRCVLSMIKATTSVLGWKSTFVFIQRLKTVLELDCLGTRCDNICFSLQDGEIHPWSLQSTKQTSCRSSLLNGVSRSSK